MTAIARQSAKIFAQNAPVGQVTAFRTTESTPQTTKAPDQIQNENYLQGWLNADGSGNVLPYAEDMNGLFYTLSYNTAYLYEKGIPEYSSTQTYYLNSFCQYGGNIYKCKGDSVINIAPTNTNYWDVLPSTSYTATTVGAATTNYGTVYAGTNTAGTQFQFKTIIGGSNVTISETADSLTISSTGGGGGTAITASAPLDLTNNVLSIPAATSSQGGYLTAADWTSFNSKLSSTIFSSNNTWTGTNNFNDILPNSNNTSSLGSETNAWLEVYANYILSNANDHLTIGNTTDLNRVLVNYITNGGDWGIFPDTISGTESNLGNSVYSWDNGYITTINTSEIDPISTSISIDGDILPKNTTNYSIGGRNNRWSYVFANNLIFSDSTGSTTTNHNFIGYVVNTNSYRFCWYSSTSSSSDDTQELFLDGNNVRPGNSAEISLGDSTHIFDNGYFSTVMTSEINTGATQLKLTATDHLYVIPNQAAGKNAYLGNSSNYWYSLYVRGFNFQNGNVSLNGAAGADLTLLPNPPSNYNSYLGNSSYSWTGGYITTVTSNKVNFRTGTTGRASMYVLDDGRFIIERTSDYGTTKTLVVRNRTAGVQLADGATSWAAASDIRLKENIEPIQSALDEILHLNPVKYSLKEHHLSYADRAGFIAQEVQPYIPEVVTGAETDDEYLGLAYTEMIPFMVKAIQELSAKVDDLQQQLMELKK